VVVELFVVWGVAARDVLNSNAEHIDGRGAGTRKHLLCVSTEGGAHHGRGSHRLHERFRGRRFIPADPPDFLDREGIELILIDAEEDVFDELGVRLDPQRETIERVEIFNKLKMERTQRPLMPLLRGDWK
jgi:hypothetical protein